MAKLDKKTYEAEIERLHGELVRLQLWLKQSGHRVVVLFEGRDGAGKGGVIKRITERVSPRVFRVVALPAPSERERTQLYFQRYFMHLPAGGEVVIFDRSWYNRAGVEHVMGFCTDDEYQRFLVGCPQLEAAIIRSGIQVIKYWLEVSPDEQTRRLRDRIEDPRKLWKLSPMDVESYGRWDDYTRSRDAMFAATDTEISPWHVVPSDDKRKARLNCISHLLSLIPYKKVPGAKVKLPDRKVKRAVPADHPFRYIPDRWAEG
ncbi:MAG: polyphosphate kinase 2 [Inquilinus sp.]|uniref:polyphosphate kinase 2 n=1 Tax=Inquilinus sp. TaxID=1932117 RepID=UPI003F404E41